MKKEIKKNRIIIILAFILGLTGIILFSYDYIVSKINLTFESINLELYGNKMPEFVDDPDNISPTIPIIPDTPSDNSGANYNYEYIGYINIPKINLTQGLVSVDSPYNDVDQNIQTIKPSDYPDVEGGNFILASHSGNSSISYFKRLYLLKENDKVIVSYNGIKYTYNIVKIYDVDKNGKVAIYRDSSKTSITLITCTKHSNDLQTVYIGQLESKEAIL